MCYKCSWGASEMGEPQALPSVAQPAGRDYISGSLINEMPLSALERSGAKIPDMYPSFPLRFFADTGVYFCLQSRYHDSESFVVIIEHLVKKLIKLCLSRKLL